MYYILLIILLLIIAGFIFLHKYNANNLKRGTTYNDNMGDFVKKLNKKFKKKKKKCRNLEDVYKYDDVTEFNHDFFDFKNNVNQIADPDDAPSVINIEDYKGMKIKDVFDVMTKNIPH